MASVASLSEPNVLAHAKERLFPDPDEDDTYAVVDTQFAVDVERGVVQAYDRLHEANAAYVVAPERAVSQSDQTLARELNIGVLGVAPDGTVDPLEIPRVVGNRTSAEATAIRFQATAQGVADKSFGLNHPKNYLAYPLAAYHAEETDAVLAEHVVRAVDDARRGAAFLGLVEDRPDGIELTPLGGEVVRFALRRYASVDDALRTFEDWVGSRKRFCDLAPEWGLLARRVAWQYPATQLLVEEGGLDASQLADGTVFHSPTVFQLKAMLYHCGILTERGAEPHRLDPLTDVWKLCEPLEPGR